jgi:branched-chain amino acid transport system permease protein
MTRVVPVLLALVLLSLPWWIGSGYYVNIASQVLIWALFALALNVLVGWGGLVSLGHAGLFGMGAYALAWLLAAGVGQVAAALLAIAFTLLVSLVFGLLALRATGIGFLMITLALSQIFWGIAYRWIDLTNGDNGIIVRGRPEILGLSIATPAAFYVFTLAVFGLALVSLFVFNRSPFGASLRGTRDQPRRMSALGFDVWLIRLMAVLVSGFWSGIAGLMFVYYHQFVSPHVLALTTSAEVLLMVIAGGPATLLGPVVGAALVVVMKNVASAYIERWNLVLGAIFVAIVLFMPEGIGPGVRRLWHWLAARRRRGSGGAPTPGGDA